MKIKAKVNFAGKVSMSINETREVDDAIAKDLIESGYAEEIKEKSTKTKKASK